ncbi:MAG: ATP-binding protein, partial [Candidatus Yanofskybacteria bacterium]|nr:ATP-binding protein [Candidatus Yanofskybacteria bacterium]
FVKRICIVGAESTGTTTMAKALAKHYQTNWVPEYGRESSEAKMYRQDADKWQTNEFIEIAKEQCRREDLFARTANKVLICDTDAFATGIWHERYVGSRSKEVEAISKNRKYDLYLLTDIDIPFTQDGTRDGEHIREWMHNVFIERLTEENKKFEILSGNHEKRLAKAINLVDSIIQN